MGTGDSYIYAHHYGWKYKDRLVFISMHEKFRCFRTKGYLISEHDVFFSEFFFRYTEARRRGPPTSYYLCVKGPQRRTDHDLYIHSRSSVVVVTCCRCRTTCDICISQIQPRKHVADHADDTDHTRQHES